MEWLDSKCERFAAGEMTRWRHGLVVMQTDVIVIGAGISGLAAANALAADGWRVLILEARDRTGGRILSVKPPGWPVDVELGAEFVHGGNAALRKIIRRSRVRTRRVDANLWWRDPRTGVVALIPDYWERIGRVIDRIPAVTPGWSFEQFLDRRRSAISPADRKLAGDYVGGFEAAPIGKISADALREDRGGTDTVDMKIAGRNDALIHELERQFIKNKGALNLNCPVCEVHWSPGRVIVQSKSNDGRKNISHEAKAVVVTLPLGVLQKRRVKFYPALRRKQALIERLGWGHVVRIVLRLKSGFWSSPIVPLSLGRRRGRGFGFINAPGRRIPVWWALFSPVPILTGWAGGELSRSLRHQPSSVVRDEAVRSLAEILGTTARRLRPWIEDWQCHQWSDDPFSEGGYSFPAAGLEHGAAKLGRPVSSTIFFAGEATAREYGTMHGALESGLRAAKEVKQVLGTHAGRRNPA